MSSIKYAVSVKDEITVSRRNITISNYSTGIAGNLIGGNFLTGFLLLLNADDAFMGMVTMVSFMGNLLQIFSPLLLERFPQRKRILIASRAIIYFLNVVVIGLVPFFGFTDRSKLMMVLLMILFVNLISALTAPGFAVWHIKSIPENIRAGYYSFFSVTNGIIIYTMILGASRLVDAFKASGREMQGLLILRILALIFCAADIFFLFRVKEYPNKRNDCTLSIVNVIVAPFKEKKYLITVAIACLWSFAANIPGPYFTVYLLKDLKVDYSYINLVNMLNIPILVLFTPVWKRRIQSTSWFKTLYFSMGIYLTYYIGLSFVTSRTMFLYPLSLILAFMVAPGINLAFSNIPYINIPEGNQTNYIGFYSAMNNLAAFLGVTLGREFITHTENMKIGILGMTMQNKQYILLLTSAVMILSTAAIYFLQKRTEQ